MYCLGLYLSPLLLAGLSQAQRSVQVDLRAPAWARHPASPLAEVAEFVAEASADRGIWTFIDAACDSAAPESLVLPNATAEALAHSAIVLGHRSLPSSMHRLMETAVGLGIYQPAVQFYANLAKPFGDPCGSGAFAVRYPGETVVCDSAVAFKNDVGAAVPDADKDTLDISGLEYPASWDHTYPIKSESSLSKGDASSPLWVLYGSVGSQSFCAMHRAALSAGAGESFRYSVRHAFPGSSPVASSTALQGFGVFLDIKNLEYKNVDDSSRPQEEAGGDAGADVSFTPGEEVKGIDFSVIAAQHPELAPKLAALRDELVASAAPATEDTEGSMKAWKIADLGYQTALSIMAAKDRVWRMEQLLHNFPAQASSLSGMRVSSDIRQVFQSLYSTGLVQSGAMNSVLVNGVPLDLASPSFCIFDVIKAIQAEYKRVEEFNLLPYAPRVKRTLKAASEKVAAAMAAADSGATAARNGQAPAMDSIARIDISKGGKNVVLFLNNLERDPMYSHFASSVKTLMRPSWSLHSIAKNLYTLVAVIDPFTREGSELAMALQSMHMNQFPIRFGFVLDPRRGREHAMNAADLPAFMAQQATPADFIRVFSWIKSREKLRGAFDFLFHVAGETLNTGDDEDDDEMGMQENEVSADGQLSLAASSGMTRQKFVDVALSFLVSRKPTQKKDSLRGELVAALLSRGKSPPSVDKSAKSLASASEDDEAVDLVEESLEYLDQRGLPKNSFSFNGIIVPSIDVQSHMMSLLGREQYFLSNMVREGTLTDRTKSAFNLVLKESKTYLRYHQVLDEQNPTYLPFDDAKTTELLESQAYLYSDGSLIYSRDSKLSEAPNTAQLWFPLTKNGLRDSINAIRWINSTEANTSVGSRIGLVPMSAIADGTNDSGAIFKSKQDEDAFASVLCAIVGAADAATTEKAFAARAFIEEIFKSSDVSKGIQKVLSAYPALKDIEGSTSQQLKCPAPSSAHAIANAFMFSKQMQSEYGLDDTSDATSLCVDCASHSLLVYNARIIKVAPGKSHNLDFDILASVEDRRLNVPLRKQLKASGMTCADVAQSSESVNCVRALSDSFVFFASYAGASAKKSTNRIDVKGAIENLPISNMFVKGTASLFSSKSDLPAASLFSGDILPQLKEGEELSEDIVLTVMVDPLSISGQRAAAVVRMAVEHLRLPVHLVLVPPYELSEFPLKNFYRFVANPSLDHYVASSADATGSGAVVPESLQARFHRLPRSHIFTARLDVPESWNVQTASSPQDMDNLVCDAKSCGDAPKSDLSTITYSLKSLLVTGQCFEKQLDGRMSPPNGLQLTLDSKNIFFHENAPAQHADTLVMQNLGYFQLQASNPGLFVLRLADGKARSLFLMEGESFQGKHLSHTNDPSYLGFTAAVKSFSDLLLQVRVNKRPGFEHIPLLDDPEEPRQAKAAAAGASDMWSSITGLFSGSKDKSKADNAVAASEDDTIHVFSLATGHVYERLLRIMMLSVSKRTESPLKFWLFENYLSPTFKKLAEAMAQQYGFQVGYVTYKWPKWLTKQTEKQRIIWGYKILFLDVLFPLNVKKVIYVDADQVVRSDLKELWDMDMEGKPYGYVPFCSSRKETLGFQFWRSGYWESHLQGRPYHISALYVVDLTVFRRFAVGDRLRAVYDTLARDPNSLANLDQDLPNYAQHSVPIFSLPQEWLWCETWCSDESKPAAKTIDLCNNPMHKEPKLDMARRIINGSLFKESWVELDEEVHALELKHGVNRGIE